MRKISFIIQFIMLCLMPVISFASNDSSYDVTKTISKSVIGALSWIGYMIAFGILLVIGIKYVMSGASEKANLKGKIPIYLIGVVLIITASTIAKFGAKVAGNEDADTVINRGLELANLEVGIPEKVVEKKGYNETNIDGKTVYTENDVEVTGVSGKTQNGEMTVLTAPKYDEKGNELLYWRIVKEDGSEDFRSGKDGELTYQDNAAEFYPVYSQGSYTKSLNDIEKVDKIDQVASYTLPNNVLLEYFHNKPGLAPAMDVPATSVDGKKFKYWIIEEYNVATGHSTVRKNTSTRLKMPELEGEEYAGKQYRYIAVYDWT